MHGVRHRPPRRQAVSSTAQVTGLSAPSEERTLQYLFTARSMARLALSRVVPVAIDADFRTLRPAGLEGQPADPPHVDRRVSDGRCGGLTHERLQRGSRTLGKSGRAAPSRPDPARVLHARQSADAANGRTGAKRTRSR